MDELLAQFLLEAPELLQQATDSLLALEADGGRRDRLDDAFRAVHTLKGSVALFDMAPLGEALHAGEDRLAAARQAGRLEREAVDPLLELLGALEGWLAALGAGGAPPPGAAELCDRLAGRLRSKAEPGVAPAAPADAGTGEAFAGEPPAWAQALLQAHGEAMQGEGPRVCVRLTPDPDAFFRGEDPLEALARLPGLLALDLAGPEPWPAPEDYDPYRCVLTLSALAQTTEAEARAALRLSGATPELWPVRGAMSPEREPGTAGEAASEALGLRLRVEPARVDALLEGADALMAAVGGLGRVKLEGEAGRELSALTRQVQRHAADLHGAVMRVRLAPLARTFERLPRVVRDLSARLGKPARLELEGGELEADRTVVDGVYEPLLHLLRNALDHGVEDAAGRRAAGKPETAVIRLSARARDGELRLELSDDGRGVDVQAVRRSAAAKGLIDPAAVMDDAGALELLFAPGFSTAAQVSAVSGRGVGLDSVRAAVEALGGRIVLASEPGRRTTASLRLPLSAMLTRLLLLEVEGEVYGAPLASVLETGRLARDQLSTLAGRPAAVWRGRALPLVELRERLGLPPAAPAPTLRLLVVDVAGERTGLVVDRFAGRLEAVVRPLTGLLAGLPGMLGTATGADGAVIFVLDPAEMVA